MPDAVLAHCWTGRPELAWYPQWQADLETSGWQVRIPELPDTDSPVPSRWLDAFRAAAGAPHENLVLVGHSLGCATVLAYLQSLPHNVRVGGIVLVAAFSRPLGIAAIDAFHIAGFDWAALKQRPEPKHVILGGRDSYLANRLPEECEHFARELGADVHLLANGTHFSPAFGCTRLPAAAMLARHCLENPE